MESYVSASACACACACVRVRVCVGGGVWGIWGREAQHLWD